MSNTGSLRLAGEGVRGLDALVALVVAAAFLALYTGTITELVSDWLHDPEYGHGLLLVPVAGYLAFRKGLSEPAAPFRIAGVVILAGSVALFLLGTVAAEFFTRRLAVLASLVGLTLYYRGSDQARAWWLPFSLLLFTIPIPEVVLNSLTLPLQLLASRAAVSLLQFRHVPAELAGNIILLPDHRLFVAEACSGLRSLSALLGLTLLIGGTALAAPPGRLVLLALAVPAALAANTFRVFMTGYLVYYVGSGAAEGAIHTAMGIGVFVLALGLVTASLPILRRMDGCSGR